MPKIDAVGIKAALKSDAGKFFVAIAAMGVAGALYEASFNNYLAATWKISGAGRSGLELPRELPGFLNVFVAAALAFLPVRRLGAVAMVLQAAGLALLAMFSPSYSAMTWWLFVYSLGQHLFLPLRDAIGMELAASGGEGRLLGRANALGNLARVGGGALGWLGFGFLGFSFRGNFLLTAGLLVAAGVALALMAAPPRDKSAPALVLKKRYGLFYLLSVLFGTRKQLFITFAPWVIVTVYGLDTATVAGLYFACGIAGVVFQPLIGRAVDRLGERFMLGLEAAVLVPVCVLYGFAQFMFPRPVALAVVAACYIADSILLSFGMARSIWLKKTAETPADVAPTLAMGVSIDHIFSISVALAAGFVWDRWGYQWVFLAGAGIAVGNFIATRWVRTNRI
jgi:predicted MFS family arabinose efflux permease